MMIHYAAIGLALVGATYIRVAPSDAARWHTDPGAIALTDCTQLTTSRVASRVSCLHQTTPADVLARLDSIALASPRTIRLAGSAETRRITWVTRSLLLGFPDYTTAQATQTKDGTRLDLIARLRFGGYDNGVNAARLANWLKAL